MRSMTAYAKKEIKSDWGYAAWELRSVNHRYLDLSFKMDERFRNWEPAWRTQLSQLVHRGKIECHLYFKPSADCLPNIQLNTDLLQKLKLAGDSVSEMIPTVSQWSIKEILQWPNVIQPTEEITQDLQSPLTTLLLDTVEQFIESRKREGAAIYDVLNSRRSQILHQIHDVKELMPDISEIYKDKIIKKMESLNLLSNLDHNRFEQEMVYFMQRSDVSEEIDRLLAHAVEVEKVMQNGVNIGRRLDFLMQEMNREANTLASKSCHETMTKVAVELKVLIEQMREQIQNVE